MAATRVTFIRRCAKFAPSTSNRHAAEPKIPSSAESSFQLIYLAVKHRMAKQLEMQGCAGHGGKRKGAGRPNLSGLVSHMKREPVNWKLPLHINTKIRAHYPSMRRKDVVKIFEGCCARTKKFGLHVIHFTIQSNHIHLICEAKNNEALGRGMQALLSSFAKALKKQMLRWKGARRPAKGSLFNGRYHLRAIHSPTQMKRTLRYVLLNDQKHTRTGYQYIDLFSSAPIFPHWHQLLGKSMDRKLLWDLDMLAPLKPEDLGLSPPQSWLAREGWMRAAHA
jgi:REP element-mobilizing transposase RayT